MRIGIITSSATSLMNVARDIAYVCRRQGHVAVVHNYMVPAFEVAKRFDAAIVVMTMNPLIARPWFLLARDVRKEGAPCIVYTTVEGKLPSVHVKSWMTRELEFVANSRYTASRLEEAGLTVLDTVHHGVCVEEADLALKHREDFRKYLNHVLGDGIYLGVVCTNHPRKGLRKFVEVVKRVREKCREAKFYIITTKGGKVLFENVEGVYVDTLFGARTRTEVLSIMSAFHYYVHPSLAEGFGLPVLEAMALGVLSIHLAYDPLLEFSRPDFNFTVPYSDIEYNDFGEGIMYELHLYDPKQFAETILEAVDVYLNRRSEYEDRAAKARKAAENFDVTKLYQRLLSLLT